MDLAANQSPVPSGGLNSSNNLLFLLEEAHGSGLISDSELQNIQIRILDLLKDVIIIYTSNQSSSVKEETAQTLMLSIIYCLDFYGMKMDNHNNLVQMLRSASIKEIYKEGLESLYAYVEETKELFLRVKAERLATRLVAYNSSIDEAIPDFFAHYDVRFSAHDTAAGIDYPLMFDDMSFKGIVYIRQYLEKLSLENAFCRLFAPRDLEYLMKNYGRTYRIRYQDYLLNICEIVLTNAIFSVLLGNPSLQLNISRRDHALLEDKLKRVAPRDLPFIIRQAINTMLAEVNVTEPDIVAYLHQYETELLARLNNALRHGTLNKLVITNAEADQSSITFDPGKKMDNSRFRLLVGQVLNCADPTKKASIIMTNVTSVLDFIDILKADCLFEDDYSILFGQLGDLELSVLVGMVFSEGLRTAASLQDAVLSYSESPIEWENHLAMFMQNISPDRLKTIENLI